MSQSKSASAESLPLRVSVPLVPATIQGLLRAEKPSPNLSLLPPRRERIRALGPTNKPDHGKQALGGADVDVLIHAQGAARSKGRVDLIRRK